MADLDDLVASRAVDAVVALTTLRAVGMTKRAIAYRVKQGLWTRPHREVYVIARLVSDPVRTSARAGLMAAPAGAAASHVLAAHLHRFEGLPKLLTPEVTVPATQCRRRVNGLVIHRSTTLEVVQQRGLAVTPVGRTIADLAGVVSLGELLCAADSALHKRLLTPAELCTAQGSRSGEAATVLRRVVELANGLSESPLETLIRLLLVEAGLGPLTLQITVSCGGFSYRIDLGFPELRLGIEADGRAVHGSADAVLNDRRRQNALLAAGWLILRFTWDDVVDRPAYVVSVVRQAIAESTGRAS
jgi:very-short-patch-repair endonuclease